jgi:hypothetical protein
VQYLYLTAEYIQDVDRDVATFGDAVPDDKGAADGVWRH